MKKFIIILISLYFSACVEEVNDLDTNFVKIYGEELDSSGKNIYELPNGDLLILGSYSRAGFGEEILFNNEGTPVNRNKVNILAAPSIIHTDRFGNVKQKRVYPADSIKLSSYVGRIDVSLEGSVVDIIQLSNGHFLAFGKYDKASVVFQKDFIIFPKGYASGFPGWNFYMILDGDLNLLHIRYSFDTDDDFVNDNIVRKAFYKLPDGNIAVLWHNADHFIDYSGAALMKLTSREDTIWGQNIYPEDRSKAAFYGTDLYTDENSGNMYLLAERRDSPACDCINHTPSILIINDNGDMINQVGYGQIEWPAKWDDTLKSNEPRKILKTINGFAIAYRKDTVDIDPKVELGAMTNRLKYVLGLQFLDESLNEIKNVEITEFLISDIIGAEDTPDGGFVFLLELPLSNQAESSAVLLKTDDNGKEIWRRNLEGSPNALSIDTDGTILVLMTTSFNNVSYKAKLFRFSSNGML